MIFKQLFEPLSSTYTYLLGDPQTGQAILIDPVIVSMERDLGVLHDLGLTLAFTLDTHIHADHITAALALRNATGSKIAAPAFDNLPCADVAIEEGRPFEVGGISLQPLHTPGHTDGHFSYLLGERVFTGDALLIDGCGRTDFQSGSAEALYDSVTRKLFTLDDHVLVWPGHDYKGQSVSSIGWERKHNARLANRTRDDFIALMAVLDLPRPRMMDIAVPANRNLGLPHSV